MIMKKITNIILSIVVTMSLSCQKEMGQIQIEEPERPFVNQIIDGIPSEITAYIANDESVTKTAYSPQGEFTWVNSDAVRLITTTDLDNYSTLDYSTYSISSLENGGKMAHFTGGGNNSDLPGYPTDGDWKSTGIAIYPTGLAQSNLNSDYGSPFVKLQQSVQGTLDEIILTGVAQEGLSTFKFSTATSVLKLTINDIPANAKQIRLYTSNKDSYPINGDFMLRKGDDNIVTIHSTDYKKYYNDSYHSANDYIYVSLSGESSKTIYLNLPVGEYPAGTLSVMLCDVNGGQIMKRTINQNLSLNRNECLEIPSLSFTYSVAFTSDNGGSVTNPRISWTIYCKRIRFCVSKNPDISIGEFNNGYTFAFGGENETKSGSYSDSYNLSGFAANRPSTSGKYYMHFILQSDRGNLPTSLDAPNVVKYGTIPFYYSNGDVENTYVGEYGCSFNDGGASRTDNPNEGIICHPGTGAGYEGKMTLAASDDLTKGNIMLTKLYKQSPDSGHQLYGYLDADNNKIVFPYAGDTNQNYFFVSWNGNYFHIASCKTVTFANAALSTTATGNLEFSINNGELTHSDYLMMKYTSDYSSWDAFVYGKGLVFTK